ncbi:MAG TPA: lipoprotein insertase outer membrane protein LolB [Burkholderiaceae bacterium]|nr:lipoprotein insertase outer membrane protein LolB [Burkholderiaceae bacterium]
MAWITSFFHYFRRAAGLLAMPLLLAGCATVNPPAGSDAGTPAGERQAARSYHDAIYLGGRMSMRYQQNGNDQAVHGSFTWAQSPGRTVVTLLSPLGQTIAAIDITPNLSTLTRAGQAPRTATDVDALAAGALGWPLPVSGLRDWLQGFATDADGKRFVAAPYGGTTDVTTRDGWRIHYSSWQDDAAQNRPKRIDLSRNTVQAGDVAIRLVIDTWQPREPIGPAASQ